MPVAPGSSNHGPVLTPRTAWAALGEILRNPGLHRDAIFIMAGTVLAALGGLVYWHFVTTRYPAEAVGVAAAGLSSASFLSAVANLGLTTGLVRFSPGASRREKAGLNTFSHLVSILASLIVLIGFLMGKNWWAPSFLPLQYPFFYQLSFLLLAVSLAVGNIHIAILQAERRTPVLVIRSLGISVLQIACVLILPVAYQSVSILWTAFIPNLLFSIVQFWLNVRLTGVPCINLKFRDLPVRPLVNYSLGNLVFNLLWGMPAFAFPLIALNLLGPQSSAFLAVTWLLYNFIAIIPNSTMLALLIEGSHTPGALGSRLRMTLETNLVLLAPIALLVVFTSSMILNFFGHEYAWQSSSLLRLLALSCIPVSINSTYFTLLRIRKQVFRLNLLAFIMVFGSMLLSILLVRWIGLNGIGWGWLVGQMVSMLGLLPAIFKELRAGTRISK